MKTRFILVVGLALAVAACGAGTTTQATLVDAAAANDLINDNPGLVVLDIRTPEEVAGGTLPGAQVIDFYSSSFQQEIAALDHDATYLVYCRSGSRSEQATRMMADLGFSDVYELDGGVVAWVNDGRSLDGG